MARKLGHEQRSRVLFHLPINDIQEEKAAHKVLSSLREQRSGEPGVQGYTHSVLRPTSYRGWWWSAEQEMWLSDEIVVVAVDVDVEFGDQRLSGFAKELKSVIRRWYRYVGSRQEEIWLIAYPVTRFD